jgi:hypothetical protein
VTTKPGKHTPYFELVDAQRLAGCPVCRLVHRTTDRYLDSLLYESVLDPTLREKLKRSHGFCSEHVEMLRNHPGRSLGIALIYETLLRRVTDVMEEGNLEAGSLRDRIRGAGSHGRALAGRLAPDLPCPACEIKHEATRNNLELLIAFLDDDKLYEAYAEGEGLCLPHLAWAVSLVSEEETLQRLLLPQISRYRLLLADLAEYIRKSDHRFRHETLGPEGDVWLRVMNAITGGAGLGLGREHSPRGSGDLAQGGE